MVDLNPKQKFAPQFPGQREDEEILTVLFRHWYVVVVPLLKALVIILLSFFIPLWFNFAGLIFSYTVSTVIYYLWIIFWVSYIIYEYLNWYRDRFIITTQRIIDIDQQGLMNRRVSEIELDRIQNITHVIAGLFPTLLNFGTVIIQSAGANELTLDHVANPAIVQEDITRLVKKVAADTPVTAEDLIDLIKERKEKNL